MSVLVGGDPRRVRGPAMVEGVTSRRRNVAERVELRAAAGRHGERADSMSSEADDAATSSAFARNVRVAVSSEIIAGSPQRELNPRLWIPRVPAASVTGTVTAGGLGRVGRRDAHGRAGRKGDARDSWR